MNYLFSCLICSSMRYLEQHGHVGGHQRPGNGLCDALLEGVVKNCHASDRITKQTN